MVRASIAVLVSAVLLSGVLGCGGANLPELATATVTITYKGKPVDGATVVLSPKAETGGQAAFGTTNAQGIAEMRYPASGAAAATGAVPGEYAVTVEKGSEIPAKYGAAETTDLSAKITDGGDNNFKFDLQD